MRPIITLPVSNPSFSKNLIGLPDCPKQLFILGKLVSADARAVAIVGTRSMSAYGRKTAYDFSYNLAKKGITIISGLARGIDTIAHKAALEAEGRTIAVMASGLDWIYPPENKSLAEEITKNGALVSEFPVGTKPLPKNFLQRNRLVSGLSLAVLVVEGRRRSGTLSTAIHAANQGREVFAIPGPITSPLSDLPNYLIENGASIAKSPQDILDYLHTVS